MDYEFLLRVISGAITKDEAINLAKSTAQDNSFATTVFYDGAVIARFDHRPAVCR